MKLKVGNKVKFIIDFPVERYFKGDIAKVTRIDHCEDGSDRDLCCQQCNNSLISLGSVHRRCWGVKDDLSRKYIIPFEKINIKIEDRIMRLKSV